MNTFVMKIHLTKAPGFSSSVCLLSLYMSESRWFKSILGATRFEKKPAVNKGASSSGQKNSVGTWEEPKLEQHP